MSVTIQFVPSAELLFEPAKKESPFANREPKQIRLSSIDEPEHPLWKLSAQAVPARLAIVELFVLVLFLVGTLVGVISCVTELSHLLESDAIGHVAMKAIGAAG